MRTGLSLFLIALFAVSESVSAFFEPRNISRNDYQKDLATGVCNQSASEQRSLITEAERLKFTVRRVEFLGLTYTHDQVVRDRMTPLVNEGYLFSRKKLVQSLQSMSKLRKAIYPLRMSDVILYLDRNEQLVDMTICFKQRKS